MKFSDTEQRMIERLRKEERKWRWGKWVLLVGGFLIASFYIGMLVWVGKIIQRENMGEGAIWIFILIYPKALVMFALSGWMIGTALKDWRGNATRMLLLKLLDNYKQTDSPTSAPDSKV